MAKRLPLAKTSLVALAIITSLVLQAPTYYFPIFFKNWPPPLYSTSHYIQNGDPGKMWTLGCQLGTRDASTSGTQDSLVILDFGKMWVLDGIYGVKIFSDPTNGYFRQFLSFAQIEDRVKWYAQGYWDC